MATLSLTKTDHQRITEARDDIERHLAELELTGDAELWQAVGGAIWDCLIDHPVIRSARLRSADCPSGVRTVRTPSLPIGGEDDDNYSQAWEMC